MIKKYKITNLSGSELTYTATEDTLVIPASLTSEYLVASDVKALAGDNTFIDDMMSGTLNLVTPDGTILITEQAIEQVMYLASHSEDLLVGELESLQDAYDNSVDPEITTNATLGAFSVKAGVSNTDNVYEGLNTSGDTTFEVSGEGDVTAQAFIGDGSQLTGITNITLNSNGATQSWRMEGVNTNTVGFNSTNVVSTGRYYRFYGASSSAPTNSAQVRALPSSAFQTANANTFTLNTGTVEQNFYVALPPSITISAAIDLDAFNAPMPYILSGTVSVLDAGATSRTYNLYALTLGAPYASNHRHEITTA